MKPRKEPSRPECVHYESCKENLIPDPLPCSECNKYHTKEEAEAEVAEEREEPFAGPSRDYDSFVYEHESWGVCGRLDSPRPGFAQKDWNRGYLVRFEGIGRLYLRAVPDVQPRLDDPEMSPEVSAHSRAKLAACAPCMYRLLQDIKDEPEKDWRKQIDNVLTRARTGRGFYYHGERKRH